MITRMQMVMAILATAIVASGATLLIGGAVGGSASSAHTYHVRRGDFVDIPALGWECVDSTLPHRGGLAFVCTTSGRPPITSLWFAAHRVFVGILRKPARFDHGYLFHY